MPPNLYRFQMPERRAQNSFRDPVKSASGVGHVKSAFLHFVAGIKPSCLFKQLCSLFCYGFGGINQGHAIAHCFLDHFFEQRVMRAAQHQRVNLSFAQWRKILLGHQSHHLRFGLALFHQWHK